MGRLFCPTIRAFSSAAVACICEKQCKKIGYPRQRNGQGAGNRTTRETVSYSVLLTKDPDFAAPTVSAWRLQNNKKMNAMSNNNSKEQRGMADSNRRVPKNRRFGIPCDIACSTY